MVKYNPSTTGIRPITFTVKALDDAKVAQRIKALIREELSEVDNAVPNRQCNVSFHENKAHFHV